MNTIGRSEDRGQAERAHRKPRRLRQETGCSLPLVVQAAVRQNANQVSGVQPSFTASIEPGRPSPMISIASAGLIASSTWFVLRALSSYITRVTRCRQARGRGRAYLETAEMGAEQEAAAVPLANVQQFSRRAR